MGDLSKNFSKKEFACKCGCGFDKVNPKLIEKLQAIRDDLGQGMTITSGCRCPQYNAKVSQAKASAHCDGDAADIACVDGRIRMRLLELAIKHGIRRIGLHKSFIHIDVSETNPPDVVWFY